MPTKSNNTGKEPEIKEIDYKTEYEKLQSQFNEMKEQFAQLMKVQSENSNKVSEDIQDEEAPIIPSNKITNITNIFDGKMYLNANNKIIGFESFGMTLPVTFEDLQYICANHRTFAEKGYFFIHNKDMIHALYLDEAYKKIINKSTIEHILKLTDKQITETISNTTDTIKDTIINLIVKGVKDNKPEYADKRKIDLISELTGQDIFKLAQDLRELEKKK